MNLLEKAVQTTELLFAQDGQSTLKEQLETPLSFCDGEGQIKNLGDHIYHGLRLLFHDTETVRDTDFVNELGAQVSKGQGYGFRGIMSHTAVENIDLETTSLSLVRSTYELDTTELVSAQSKVASAEYHAQEKIISIACTNHYSEQLRSHFDGERAAYIVQIAPTHAPAVIEYLESIGEADQIPKGAGARGLGLAMLSKHLTALENIFGQPMEMYLPNEVIMMNPDDQPQMFITQINLDEIEREDIARVRNVFTGLNENSPFMIEIDQEQLYSEMEKALQRNPMLPHMLMAQGILDQSLYAQNPTKACADAHLTATLEMVGQPVKYSAEFKTQGTGAFQVPRGTTLTGFNIVTPELTRIQGNTIHINGFSLVQRGAHLQLNCGITRNGSGLLDIQNKVMEKLEMAYK